MVRSVEKFMREKYTPKTGVQGREPVSEALREFMAEIRTQRVETGKQKPSAQPWLKAHALGMLLRVLKQLADEHKFRH